MKITCGIMGLPNIGKSTLFQILTNLPVKTDNFPFCTIKPNIGIVQIPDSRLNQLNNIIKARSSVYGEIKFIDIAGLIKGAAKGLGLGNKILSYIQTATILCHVVRCFDDDIIIHTENHVNPRRDINIINTELILFDILQCEKKISFLQKNHKIIDNNVNQKLFILNKCLRYLYAEICLRKKFFSPTEITYMQQFNFLTFKPIIYIANVNKNYINNIYFQELKQLGSHESIPVIPVCAVLQNSEHQLIDQKYILNTIINNILSLLKLNTFFTINANMAKSWIYTTGITALDAASYVHSDFKRGFIRTQIIKFDDFIKYKEEKKLKKMGKVIYGGKNYSVQDGDILKFLFNI